MAILPLLLAVGYAVFSLQQQTIRQAASMERFDQLTTITGRLIDDVREQMRLARQYHLLRDETFLELFLHKNDNVRETLASAESLQLESEWRQRLSSLRSDTDLLETWLHPDTEVTDDEISRLIQSLSIGSDDLATAVSVARRTTIRQGELDFARIVDRLFLITLLTLPGTFLLMVLGTFFISRPIWRLSQAIRRLGSQHWGEPIQIRGPADLVALGDNLEWMRQQVCASDEQKTAFIQHVTHELKTPLAAIIEAASLMRDEVTGRLQPGQREVLEILFSNARHLQDLIQQLLNYNTVSHGVMVQLQSFDLAQLCTTLRHRLEVSKPGKKIVWEVSATENNVTSDPRLLEMILANLLNNAFQFTPSGGVIHISWRVAKDGWHLGISDTGPGIEQDELEHVFTPFYRGRNTREEHRPGNGIGLAIVKTSVELLKGSVSVQSMKGEGTSFALFFPSIKEVGIP